MKSIKYSALITVVALGLLVATESFAQPASITTATPVNRSVKVGVQDTVRWTSADYPQGASVDIHLLKRVSTSPNIYHLVRVIGLNVPNTGTFTWTPVIGDGGSDMLVQVVCSRAGNFRGGCSAGNTSGPISVETGGTENAAIAAALNPPVLSSNFASILASIQAQLQVLYQLALSLRF